MGEYDAITGKMWQHEFTREQPTSFTLNTKEVLAAKISQELAPYYWMIHHAVSSTPYPCHLKTKGTQSYVSSWIQYAMENSPHNISIPSEAALQDRRQIMWLWQWQSNQVV
jgi:hypothetical protein